MKKIFVVDWALVNVFALAAFTGIGLHLSAENGAVHEVWHRWAVGHIAASLLFLCFSIVHVIMHSGWYRGLFKRGIGGKSKVALGLSAVYALSVFTGLPLLLIEGAGSGVGKWHWVAGLLFLGVAALHIAGRIAPLRKSLR